MRVCDECGEGLNGGFGHTQVSLKPNPKRVRERAIAMIRAVDESGNTVDLCPRCILDLTLEALQNAAAKKVL